MLIPENWNFLLSGETGGPWNLSPSFSFTLIICSYGNDAILVCSAFPETIAGARAQPKTCH